jgi:hypothetical protein
VARFRPQDPDLLRHGDLPVPSAEPCSAVLFSLDHQVACAGYSSGIYSSSASGVADLARQFGRGKYVMPDVIFDALWNGQADTRDSVFGPGGWVNHHRLHQYCGNLTRTHGGTTMDIDRDYLDINLSSPAPNPRPRPRQRPRRPAGRQGRRKRLPKLTGRWMSSTGEATMGCGTCATFQVKPGTTRLAWAAGSPLSPPLAVGNGGIRVFYQGSDGDLWQVRSKHVVSSEHPGTFRRRSPA